MGENAKNIERAVLATLATDHTPTETEIRQVASALRTIFPVPDGEFNATLRALHAKLTITLEAGTSITTDYVPWLNARKKDEEPFYWERYRQYLATILRWPPLVVNMLDRVTDEILDLFGDPKREGQWARKGLIVGDVQSGKTATYTALACKASDFGYSLIILLTGTIESLRRQTQERLDEGLAGRDSYEWFQSNKIFSALKVGVGHIDGRRFATVFTSRSRDFSVHAARQLGFSLGSSRDPILLVCKKNAKILENLRTWLQSNNADARGKISLPLVLIDDEADSASINTNAQAAEATRTNKEIRQLLRLFDRSVYVGVTATPFANVFINPDTEDAMIGDDLFPRDFIYSLESPQDYLGPEAVFHQGRGAFLKHFDDAETTIPLSHKSSFVPSALPESLLTALRSFMITTTIRDLRGEGATHRSMLVNISRFTAVQERVAELLDSELRELQREIRLFSGYEESEACRNSKGIAALRELWRADYDHAGILWEDLQHALNSAVQPITIRTVNQRSGASALDYKANKDSGLRVVAVGGNSLSRGLTLEGLSTSYFYRNSQMYDTLLQMGRWFGYHPGFEDLCRLWLTEDAAGWYEHITLATVELREDFKRMKRLGLTPKDFGLKVRSHPDSLIVTARNKMRAARDFVHYVSLSEQGLETTRLSIRPEVNASNYKAATRFIERVRATGRVGQSLKEAWPFWNDAPKEAVVTLLQEFQSHPLNFKFNTEAIAAFLAATHEERLQLWDVAIVSRKRTEGSVSFAGMSIGPVERRITVNKEYAFLLMSGSKKRVGSGDDEVVGLTETQIQEVKREHKDMSALGKYYREKRSRPLLLLYLIMAFEGDKKDGRPYFGEQPTPALALSFPRFDDSAVANRAQYKINVVEWNARFETEAGDDDEPAMDGDEVA